MQVGKCGMERAGRQVEDVEKIKKDQEQNKNNQAEYGKNSKPIEVNKKHFLQVLRAQVFRNSIQAVFE